MSLCACRGWVIRSRSACNVFVSQLCERTQGCSRNGTQHFAHPTSRVAMLRSSFATLCFVDEAVPARSESCIPMLSIALVIAVAADSAHVTSQESEKEKEREGGREGGREEGRKEDIPHHSTPKIDVVVGVRAKILSRGEHGEHGR